MVKKTKRILFLGDFHCGHRVGLTPEPFWTPLNDTLKESNPTGYKAALVQRECWKEFQTAFDLKPDILVVNADCIDGRGEKSGSTELIETDRYQQCKMAEYIIKKINAPEVLMTVGTPYHVGTDTDYEQIIADSCRADLRDIQTFRVNRRKFQVKHHITGSSVPHGRFTAIARSALWDLLWAVDEDEKASDHVIRSHVHYHVEIAVPGFRHMVLPALQARGSKYGQRKQQGLVHWGFIWIDIDSGGNETWNKHIIKIKSQKEEVYEL